VRTPAPPASAAATGVVWRDGSRLVVFGRGTIATALDHIATPFTLLTTRRAAALAPHVAEAAAAIHEVGPGRVDELAATLRPLVTGETLVALGGGRVIDVAKALTAADPPRRLVAIPTTLSGAEMTAIHRHAIGIRADTPKARPDVVIADPEVSASQPLDELAASAANALAHAIEGPLTPMATPQAMHTAVRAVGLIAGAAVTGEPDRDRIALGALLAGTVIDSTGYGLHHVLAQTLVRDAGVGHGVANAAMLPHTLGALTERFPNAIARIAAGAHVDLVALAIELATRAGALRLRDLGVAESQLDSLAAMAVERTELALTPPPATRDEIQALYARAW
jgi:alcohol dehydrogenase class IV